MPEMMAVGTVIGAALTAAGGAVVMVIKARADAKAKEAEVNAAVAAKLAEVNAGITATARKDALEEVWKYVAELKAQNERQQAVIEQHGRAVEAFARENAEYREEAAELRQCVHFLYDHIKRAFATLKHDCGQDPGELPELPAARPRPAPGGAEFLGKQAAQSAQLLREAATSIQPPGGAPP